MELANKTKNDAEIKSFQQQIKNGIPDELPTPQPFDSSLNHAPKRKEILTKDEKNQEMLLKILILKKL